MILYTVVNGYLDDIAIDKVALFESRFYQFMDENHPEMVKSIARDKEIDSKTEKLLIKAIKEFKEQNYPEIFQHVRG